jgi:PhoD-like phosphatase
LSVPIILSGPILRRVEPDRICIWLATSKPATVKARIYRLRDLKNNNSDIDIGIGTTKTLRLGQMLHVALVIALPIINSNKKERIENINTFPTDEILAYDIEIFLDNNSQGMRLNDLGLLSDESSIAYNTQIGVPLPTFLLPGNDNMTAPTTVLHGSCRKLHGDGDDCLSAADELIAASIEDINNRPRALFLTGDQIYADDVAIPLIQYLTKFGIQLLGWEEQIHGVNKKLTEIGIGERQQLVRDHAKFTSQKAGNHLLSFGEFAAMYLLAWNAENWPDMTWEGELSTNNDSNNKTDDDISRKHLDQLKRAYRVLPKVRRVLANIPTYMIFDDHDITDDWNITKEWYDNVKNSDCGKQIVSNGLAAFWVFQGWGNNPDMYSQDFIDKITDYLQNGDTVNNVERRDLEDYLWDFHGWSFSVPTNPLAVFLDCRTQREYNSPREAPELLSEEALQSILNIAQKANHHKGDPAIIISPTPVFGFELAEKVQGYLAHLSGPYSWDLESWSASEHGFTRFITFLIEKLGPRYCVFLSGDVHYGFTMDAKFTLLPQDDSGGEKRMQAIQLTSSALKSTSFGGRLLIGDILDRIYEFLSNKKTVRIGWNVHSGTPKHIDELMQEQNKNPNSKVPNENLSSVVLHLDESSTSKNGLDILKSHFELERTPAWIESRRILKTSGYKHTCVLADNNLGMLVFDKHSRMIKHELLVRKANEATKVCEATVQIAPWVEDFP